VEVMTMKAVTGSILASPGIPSPSQGDRSDEDDEVVFIMAGTAPDLASGQNQNPLSLFHLSLGGSLGSSG